MGVENSGSRLSAVGRLHLRLNPLRVPLFGKQTRVLKSPTDSGVNPFSGANAFRPVFLILTLFLSLPPEAKSQGTAAFRDERGQFYAWEKGRTDLLESTGALEWKCAPTYLVYQDNTGELVYYQNGSKTDLGVIRPEWYEAKEDFLVYQVREQISIYYRQTKHRLGFLQSNAIAIGDSIVGFRDNTGALYAFRHGSFERLELFPVDSLKAGDNILTYVDQNGFFKAYWNGKSGRLDNQPPLQSAAGGNIAAWIDPFGRLKIFYRGEILEPEQGFQPVKIYAGRNFVAWMDDRGEHFAWYGGRTTRLLTDFPVLWGVADHLCWFADRSGYFRVFYEGQIHTLESFTPAGVLAENRVLVYTELDGRLKAFYRGESIHISNNIARDFSLCGDLVSWTERPFDFRFYRKD